MRVSTCLLVFAGLGIGSFLPISASAFCRSTTCRDVPACEGDDAVDPNCIPLGWRRQCVGVSMQANASEQVPFDVANAIMTKAFAAWEEPVCDPASGAKPNIHVENLGSVDCDLVQYNSRDANANVVVFRDQNWSHPSGPHNIALTTVTYDVNTGEIYDADLEINSAGFGLTVSDGDVQTDLLSVITHEAGHFLGLTHTEDPTATMWANYTTGDIGPRTLAVDDINAVCTSYPAIDVPIDPATCNPLPRHGFSPACLSKQEEGDCSVKQPTSDSNDSTPLVFLAGLALLTRARRARQ
jgi:Matrixin